MRPIHINPGVSLMIAAIVTATPAAAQQTSAAAQARSSAIAASFIKSKDVHKEKHGVRKDKYIRVETEPAVRQNPADYSGTYELDMGFGLQLRVNRDGTFEGTGYEPLDSNVRRTFALRNGRIQGALLTATKVYADGRTEPLEGAFMNRSRYESPTDKGVTVFGLGTLGRPITVSGNTLDKFFYEKTH